MKNLKGLVVYSVANTLERYSFYTLMTTLVYSLMQGRGYSGIDAGKYYAIFYYSTYVAFLILGLVGDFTNRRKLTYAGLLIMAGGYFLYPLLATSNVYSLILPGAFIVLGVGAFKTNLHVQVGDLYRDNIKGGILAYIILFLTMMISAMLAAFTTILLKPVIGIDNIFYICGASSLLAFILYYFVPVSSQDDAIESESQNKLSKNKYGTERVIGIVFILIMTPLLWLAIYQTAMVHMKFIGEHVNMNGFDKEMAQAMVPKAFITFAPIVSVAIYFFTKLKKARSLFLLIITGLIFVAIGFAIPAIGTADSTGKLSIMYALIPVLFITLGEVLVSPVMMYGAYHFSPFKLRGLFMGVFLALTALGANLIFTYSNVYDKHGATYTYMSLVVHILICAILVFGVWLLLKKLSSTKIALKIKADEA